MLRLPVHTKNPIEAIANAFRLARIAKERRVSLIHARSRAPAWSAFFAARMARVPFVTTFHGIYNARSSLKRFYNSIMARGDVVIANSEYTREHILYHYSAEADRVVTIPRGVDLEQFDPARVSADAIAAQRAQWGVAVGDARCVMLAPARLTRWKGQLVLIEAAAQIQARRPGALKIVFAGDAQGRAGYVQEMEAAIEAAGLRETVLIAGHLSDMPLAFAAADAALFPVTEPEAFGRGAVESQAMGAPVIASNLGGFTETVAEGETGFLVPAGAAAPLAGAIERMIDCGPETRAAMGRAGRERILSRYSKTALQAATMAVYQRVLAMAAERRARAARPEAVL